jgi:TolB protein
MDADGSGLRRITDTPRTNDSDPAWSPDGKRIAFSEGKGDIYTIKLDGTGLRQLTDDKGGEREPTWSPDGKKIAFSSGAGDIFVMKADRTKVEQLTKTQAWEHSPDWRRLP